MLKPNEVRILLLLSEDLYRPATTGYIIRNVDMHSSHVYKYLNDLHDLGLVNRLDGEFPWEISRTGLAILRILQPRITKLLPKLPVNPKEVLPHPGKGSPELSYTLRT